MCTIILEIDKKLHYSTERPQNRWTITLIDKKIIIIKIKIKTLRMSLCTRQDQKVIFLTPTNKIPKDYSALL